MGGSFRRRLLALAALTVLVFVSGIGALVYLQRTTLDERRAHARDNVGREVERLRGGAGAASPGVGPTHQSGELTSGTVAAPTADRGPYVQEALEGAAATTEVIVLERAEPGGTPVLVAAATRPGGGLVYASQRVVPGRETRGLRTVIVVMALLTLVLVVGALRTLASVERGVGSLRASLAAIATDLHAPVPRPALRELEEVADGVSALAAALARSQKERETLTRELAERERMAALGRVAAGIAHEVRNPLAAMKLRADLARTGGEATPSVARDLEDIASEIARLDRLVSDLLFVAGRRTGPHAAVDVGGLLARRVALLAPWAAEKGVELKVTGTSTTSIDADAVTRAVDNLLRNAVEASPRGASVEAAVRTEDDGATRIDVVDRGPGVAPERRDELFEPFFTTKPDGTGLGLALARAVASAHHGTLAYARESDATRFTLTLGVG
ncbi:MAG TPA: HAMP domain-containing sensor histidine kinase [Polyangiaceae bacterium]